MELCFFPVNDGFPEAIIRGLRATFLTEAHYTQMRNCSSLVELKSVQFYPFIQNINSFWKKRIINPHY